MQRVRIQARLFVAILAFAVLLSAGAWWYVNRLARAQAEQAAVHEAQRLVSQVREVREYYTRNVVATAQKRGLEITHDYSGKPGALPLPATLLHEVNEALTRSDGYSVRLYSRYPFPHRQQGNSRDAFEDSRAFVQPIRNPLNR